MSSGSAAAGLSLSALLAFAPAAAAQPAADTIRDAVLAEMSRLGIPGLSLAVAENGALVYEAAFGFADVENGVRARPETVYRLASVAKPMTAVAVLRLTERGLLDLDTPVWRYCPDFPEKPWPVTTRQLLCHRGGVRHYRAAEQPITVLPRIHFQTATKRADTRITKLPFTKSHLTIVNIETSISTTGVGTG